jgi:hypothetical protein
MSSKPISTDDLNEEDAVDRALLAHSWIARTGRTGTGGLVVTAAPAVLTVRREPGLPPVLGELAEAGLRPVIELPHADSPLAAPAQHLFVATTL